MKKGKAMQFLLLTNRPINNALFIVIIMVIITFSLHELNNHLENKIIQKNEALAGTIVKNIEHFLYQSVTLPSRTGLMSSALNVPADDGVIARDIDLSNLNKLIHKIKTGKSGYVVLIDNTGELIAHSVKNFSLEKSSAKFLFHIQKELTGKKGTVEQKILGIKIFFSMDIVSPVDWRVIAVQPMESAFPIIIQLMIIIFICILIATILYLFAIA